MAFVGRLVKSARNRARPLGMLVRGTATRALMPGLIRGGKSLRIGKSVDLVVYGELVLGEDVTLSDGCALEVSPQGRLVLGDHVFIGRHSVVVAHELIEIGAKTLVAEQCTIRDQDHHLEAEERLREVRARTAPVLVSPNVWIGAGARILRGSRIGEGSVIAANAVVRGEIPAGVVAGGIPARVLRSVRGPTGQK